MDSTFSGIIIFIRLVQFANADSPIRFIVGGRMISLAVDPIAPEQ